MQKGTVIYMGNIELPDKCAAAHRVTNNGKILKELGYRVVYLGINNEQSFTGIQRSDRYSNIYEKAYPASFKQWVKHLFDQSAVTELIAEYPDTAAVIVYNLPYVSFKAVKKLLCDTGIKVIFDCTEWETYTEGVFLKRLYKQIDEREIRKLLPRKCRNIIAVSDRMAEQYRRVNMLQLPPLVDTDDGIWHQETPARSDTFDFFFAGSITQKERLDLVVDAFCAIDDPAIRLNIAGLDEREYLGAYPHHAALLERDDRVRFWGMLSHDETIRRTLAAGCVIFIREATRKNNAGFPTKFVEAYTCGVPIITTDVSDVKQYMTSPEKGEVLARIDRETIMNAMKAVIRRGPVGKQLDHTFDYRNYISETQEWMNKLK